MVATWISAAVALAVAPIVGSDPVFPVSPIPDSPPVASADLRAHGPVHRWLGFHYNRLVIPMLDLMERMTGLPEIRAALIRALVHDRVIAPWLAGGGGGALGDRVLMVGLPISTLLVVFVVRWFFRSPVVRGRHCGRTFAPLLVVGASISPYGEHPQRAGSLVEPVSRAFAMVGMSTFFAAVVRAPVTGVVLIVEMTATTTVPDPHVAGRGYRDGHLHGSQGAADLRHVAHADGPVGTRYLPASPRCVGLPVTTGEPPIRSATALGPNRGVVPMTGIHPRFIGKESKIRS